MKNTKEKNGIKNILRRAGIFFAMILLYIFTVELKCSLPNENNLFYFFHCVDFDMGFCTKFLPGAFYNLFVSHPSKKSAIIFDCTVLSVFLASLSVVLSKYVESAPKEYRRTAYFTVFFFLTGSASVCTFSRFLGVLDAYWVYFSFIFILLMQTKYLKWLCPVLMFAIILTHYACVIAYIPLLCLIVLFELATAKDKKEKLKQSLLLLICVTVSLGSFSYFSAHEKSNLTYDMDVFNEILHIRGAETTSYYDYALYIDSSDAKDFFNAKGIISKEATEEFEKKLIQIETDKFPQLTEILNRAIFQIQLHFFMYGSSMPLRENLIRFAILLAVISPPLFIHLRWLIRNLKKSDKVLRIVYFCSLFLFPLITIGSWFFSTDTSRWIYHGFICLFTLMLYITYKQKDDMEFFDGIIKKINPIALYSYAAVYALILFRDT